MRGDVRAPGPGREAPGLAWLLWGLTLSGLATALWLDHLLRQAGRPDLVQLRTGGAPPAVTQLRVLGNTFAIWPACIGFILLLTPTGALPSPRWRWWAGIAVAAPLAWQASFLGFATVEFPPLYSFRNPFHVPALAAPATAVALPAIVLTLLGVVVGGASLVVRFRRARGEERQQLRWVASAAVVAAVGIPVALVGISTDSAAVVGVAVLGSAAVLCLAVVDQTMQPTRASLWRSASR